MKKFLVLFAVLAMVITIGTAQRQRYYLGPNLLFKGGVNAGSIPEGLKTGANFNGIPDFGLTFRFMFDKNSALGLLLDAQYATYSFRMRPESESFANDNNTFVFKPSYFTIAPGLYFSGVTFNVAIGFPAGNSLATVAGTDGTGSYVANVDDLNGPAIELQLGGMIAAWKTDMGVLSVLIKGGYMVTGMYKEEAPIYKNIFAGNNPAIASASIGLNYLFDLGAL
jgi:hypothetical protein